MDAFANPRTVSRGTNNAFGKTQREINGPQKDARHPLAPTGDDGRCRAPKSLNLHCRSAPFEGDAGATGSSGSSEIKRP
jgi:hypothetical protein